MWRPPTGQNRNTENRGKSGYRRASWDEALGLVAREVKRIQGTYGKEAVTAITSSHHSWGLCGYKISLFKRFFSMLGYTRIMDNPDSWEGFHWGTPHTYGYYWRLGGPEPFDMLHDAMKNTETMIMWSHDPDTTRGGYSAQESALWRWWMKEAGVQFIYIDPFNNFSSVKQADKWIAPRMGTDAALCEAIAYVWITEGTYDKEYIAKHGHRFDEWKDHILGLGPDATAKTPAWAEEITGVKAADIKAIARRWASTRTMAGSGMRGGFGGVCRTTGGTDFARLIVSLLAMQGMGKPRPQYVDRHLRRPHELQLLVRRLLRPSFLHRQRPRGRPPGGQRGPADPVPHQPARRGAGRPLRVAGGGLLRRRPGL